MKQVSRGYLNYGIIIFNVRVKHNLYEKMNLVCIINISASDTYDY